MDKKPGPADAERNTMKHIENGQIHDNELIRWTFSRLKFHVPTSIVLRDISDISRVYVSFLNIFGKHIPKRSYAF